MKSLKFWGWFLALALAAGIFQLSPILRAQDTGQAQDPSAQQQQPTTGQAFSGKIAKSGDKLVLRDMAAKTEYQLDDQDRAKPYVGKNVTIMGILDAQTNTIHVQDIEPSAG